ncbi:nuclear pore membrane glycoprotein 210-like [Paramacrobiotus metropolitanus]|uniref:nuclear pore membrane glycoprotein 210-like n=1 Tax=Paramacrobiotus metropolitanus TaxID=2943436 RepID=UPI002445DAD0|nr:nuclear pore membrane glycoprotein 210-like [Paramacrobiotus metropolitanus]
MAKTAVGPGSPSPLSRNGCSVVVLAVSLTGLLSSWDGVAAVAAGEQNKLNVPRVLLPRSANGVVANFTLRVTEDGEKESARCYTWRSTRTDVVTVTPVLLDADGNVAPSSAGVSCSSAAVVSAVSSSVSRLTSIIWAEHPSQSLRCDVMIDSIASLEIFTTTRKLFLEDAPEAFEISAKDVNGDRFSSLEGLEFDWRIEHDVRNDSVFVDGASIIKFTKFSDSEYRPPASVAALEAVNKRGYMVLLESLQTGSAIVSAALTSPVWREVGKASVRLLVVANVVLQPDYDVYLIPQGSVHYRVMQIKQSTTSYIPMPSPQYQLQLRDDGVCSLDEKHSIVACTELGNTEVRLKDRNVIEGDTAHPSSLIHVVLPAYLNLLVKPGRVWVLQNLREYDFIAELYDRESHLIFPSDNLRIELQVDPLFFQVIRTAQNGTISHVKTIKTGKTQITAQLLGVVQKNGQLHRFPNAITKVQTVEINAPVVVRPSLVLFPSDATSRDAKRSYSMQLQASGGSGTFTWSTGDGSVCQVDASSGRLTSGMKDGHTVVTAYDVRNNDHSDSANIYILPVSDMILPPAVREAEVGHILAVPVALRGRIPGQASPVVFTDCRHLNLSVSVGDEEVFGIERANQPELSADACSAVYLKALKAGFSTVKVTYVSGEEVISAEATVGAFDAMEAVDGEKEVVLAIGSSRVLQFRGGPLPWIRDPEHHRITASEDGARIVRAQTLRGTDAVTLLELTCSKIGDDSVTLEIANAPSTTLPLPVKTRLIGRVSCVHPAQLILRVRPQPIAGQKLPPCPWRKRSNDAYPVLRGQDAIIDIDVFDSLGRKLDNFSSLHFTWEVSDKHLLDLKDPHGIRVLWHGQRKHVDAAAGYKTVHVLDAAGKVTLTVHVDHYHRDALHAVKSPESSALPRALTAAVELALVEPARFPQDQLTVFNYPGREESTRIKEGSGYFHLVSSNPDLARINYDVKSRSVAIGPLLDGDFSLTAYDLCVPGKPAVLFVTVAGLARIEVIAGDKVQLGSSIALLLRAYDSAGQRIPVDLFPLLKIVPVNTANVVALREEATDSPTERLYSVHGNAVGRAGVAFKGTKGMAADIHSNSVEIQVFPPLHIEPRNITMIPKARLQLTIEGGPQPLNSLRFAVRSAKLAAVDGGGIVEALSTGNTQIYGEIVDVDPVTGKDVVYSSDEVTIHVVPFKGVRIRAPLRSIAVGQEMPLVAFGLTDQETPFTFGSTMPMYKFVWSIDNPESAGLQSVYHSLGLAVLEDNNIAMRLVGRSSGAVTVSLSATDPVGKMFKDSLVVAVVEEAQLLVPACNCDNLLMTPNARLKLRTNKDGSAQLTYRVLEGADVVGVEAGGHIQSGAQSGRAMLVVDVSEKEQRTRIVRGVQVNEPSFIKINVDSALRSGPEVAHIPLGIPLRFGVTHHDNLGREFHAVFSRLQFRTSRNDIVSVNWHTDSGNSTLMVRASKTGSTILKVWDEERSGLFDFVHIHVGAVIVPHDVEVQVGEAVCFRCGLMSADGRSGVWTSSAPGVVSVDRQSGIAVAVGPGQAIVFYNVSQTVASKTTLLVKPPQVVSIAAAPAEKAFISNVAKNDEDSGKLSARVVFGKGSGHVECSDAQLRSLVGVKRAAWDDDEEELFQCEVRFSRAHPGGVTADDVFSVRPGVDEKGDFVCNVEARRGGSQPTEEALSGFEADLVVTVKDTAGHSSSVNLEFLPGFFVATPQVHINHIQTESGVVVVAVPGVQQTLQVRSSDPSILHVGNPSPAPWPASLNIPSKPPNQKAPSAYLYPLTLQSGPGLAQRLSSSAQPPSVLVESFRTGQRTEVPVKIRLSPEMVRALPHSGATDWWSLLIPTLSIGGLLAVLYLIWRMYQQSVEDKQYYRYLAATGHAPPSAAPGPGGTPTARVPPLPPRSTPPSPLRERGSWSSAPAEEDDVRLWSSAKHLPDSPSRRSPGAARNALFRHSPNTGL